MAAIWAGSSDLIADGTASVEDGRDVWGRDTFETQDLLRARHGDRFVVTCIGPGGEKLAPAELARHGLGRRDDTGGEKEERCRQS